MLATEQQKVTQKEILSGQSILDLKQYQTFLADNQLDIYFSCS